jgi:hypothetical protein
MKTYSATVVNGQLQLDEPVGLSDHCRVQVTVVPAMETQQQWIRALDALAELKQQRPISSGGLKFSREELYDRH